MKLTDAQINYFNTFGYLLFRGLYPPDEMARIVAEADALMAKLRPANQDASEAFGASQVLEQHPVLSDMVDDDRVYLPVSQLLGEDFIWGGSEFNYQGSTTDPTHWWHCDRGDCLDLPVTWIKCLLYFEPTMRENGSLRVIPGSHKTDWAKQLLPLQEQKPTTADRLYGVPAHALPCVAMETQPGDLVTFNQFLFHGVFGKQASRRYLAMKFVERPTRAEHVRAYERHCQSAADLHEAFVNSSRPRIRKMADGVIEATKMLSQ